MRIALGLLPFLTFLTTALVLHVVHSRQSTGERPSFRNTLLQAMALFGLWLVLGTELYSKLNILYFWPVLFWWLLPFLGCLLYLARHRTEIKFQPQLRWPTFPEWLVLLPLAALLLLAFLSAAFSPPNNYDSYSYHLPRQIIWIQQGNVRDFSTNNLRQLMMAPYTEFVGVHTLILANSDRLLNLIQYSALLLMLLPVSLLTRRLGGKPIAQLLACLFVVTCPVVFFEASNTKNDMMVGMWILICTWWLVRVLDGWRMSWFDALLLGGAIGCAADTKGTGPLYVIMIVILLTIALLWRRSPREFAVLVLVGLVSIAVNVPQYARNLKNFGHLNGPTVADGGYPIYNTSHRPGAILSNVVRNLAWHAAIPNQAFNDKLYAGVVWLHDHVFHIGINDTSTTTPYSFYDRLEFHGRDEDRAGAPAHVLLLLLLPIGLLLMRRRLPMGTAFVLIAVATAGFVIFCAAIKWEEWHTRYYIAITALLCPVFATALTGRFASILAPLLGAVAFALMVPGVLVNSRPVFGPSSIFLRGDLGNRLFYIGHPEDYLDMAEIAAHHHAKWIGLATNGDFPDYIFMHVLRKRVTPTPQFEYVQPFIPVKGVATHRADIILTRPDMTAMWDQPTHTRYFLYRRYESFNLLLPETDTTTDKYPPFFGWTTIEGITAAMGPYPQWQLPLVRWGTFPATRLRVEVPTADNYRMVLLGRRNDNTHQTMTIEVNGKTVATHAFDGPFNFEPMTIDFLLHAGENEVTFRYASGDPDGPPQRAVLFSQLQIVPARIATRGSPPVSEDGR